MKNALFALVVASSLLSGCFLTTKVLTQENKDKIIEIVKTDGVEAAYNFIDKLVEDGNLGINNAEKIKEAIPAGIEKLEEVLNKE